MILIQADHGPVSRRAVDAGELDEEFGVFTAAFFPDRKVTVPENVSPLNAARLLASEYFGVSLEPLVDKQLHADLMRPYAWTRANPEEH